MALSEAEKKARSEYLEKHLKITECSQRKPYVFISYASDNWEQVFKEAVVPMQKQYGLRVYADKAFDKVNDKWIVPMLRNIRGADAVVAFVSQSYIESYACFLELLTAVNNRKQIIFVSMEEGLHLGDTTDLPIVERGAKNEILNQGANISTNTNNTSNDIMRAMKSAYTSISTLLEQDALSKYDISDAFINFFRDASINRKTINDLRAVRGTINSVSKWVFDKSLVVEQPKAAPVQPAPPPGEPAPVQSPVQTAPPLVEPAPVQSPVQTAPPPEEPAPVQEELVQQPQREAEFTWDQGKKGRKKPDKKFLIGGAAVFVAVVMIVVLLLGGSKSVKDQPYTLLYGDEVTYTGKWKNDQPVDGEGKIVWESGIIYEGEFKEGNPNGQGTCTYTDGRTYTGAWATSDTLTSPCGQGIMTLADGGVYEGEWSGETGSFLRGTATLAGGDVYEGEWDKETGNFLQGTITFANGDVYEGEWDKETGYFLGGTIKYTNGDVYEGAFKDGEYHGQGTLTHADGTVESGEWVNGTLIQTVKLDNGTYTGALVGGKPNGWGTMEYTNGQVYVGDWVDGKREGKGRCTWPDGGFYDGEWKDDKWNGEGTNYIGGGEDDPEIHFYVGEFVDGLREGHGTYTWPSGDVAEGEWKNGKRNGPCVYIWKNGNILEGEWVNGEKNGILTMTYPNGTVIYEQWDHGTLVEKRDKDGNLVES